MDLRKVLFLGGQKMASVQIRCVDIAKRLGCDCILGVNNIEEICDRYSVFVCVKPNLASNQHKLLAGKGKVIWDIIDSPPPEDHVDTYLASTELSKEVFKNYGRIVVIPHHHCNFSGTPNPVDLRQPGWIGSRHWCPKFRGFDCDYYNIEGLGQQDVISIYRKIGIGLNFRNSRPSHYAPKHRKLMHNFHIAVNSGIKLINCIGFGTPSVSANEPAYQEIDKNCTLISDFKKCSQWVRMLKNDDEMYLNFRVKLLKKSAEYHINAIAEKYRKLIRAF